MPTRIGIFCCCRSAPFTGTYRIDGDRLVLEGKLGPDPVRIQLVKESYRFPSIGE